MFIHIYMLRTTHSLTSFVQILDPLATRAPAPRAGAPVPAMLPLRNDSGAKRRNRFQRQAPQSLLAVLWPALESFVAKGDSASFTLPSNIYIYIYIYI